MTRKKKHEEHENLERWLVSYADFITLLFATFVVLYALSQLDLARFAQLKQSVSEAFSNSRTSQSKAHPISITPAPDWQNLFSIMYPDDHSIVPSINPELELKKMQQVKEEIQQKIKDENIDGVSVKIDKRGLVITLLNSLIFDSGSAQIKPEGEKTLNKVANVLKKDFSGNQIRIEGHTDSDPINSILYPSNWELSAVRATSVVRYFIDKFKVSKSNISASGYADSIPVAPNDSEYSKQRNRRVEIVVLNSQLSKFEPNPAIFITHAAKKQKKNKEIEVITGIKKPDETTTKTIEFQE